MNETHEGWVVCKSSRTVDPFREIFPTKEAALQWVEDNPNPVGYRVLRLSVAWEEWAKAETERAGLLSKHLHARIHSLEGAVDKALKVLEEAIKHIRDARQGN